MSVYFAYVHGYVKIGYSAKPRQRASTITTGSCIKPDDVTYGDEVYLLGWIPGDRKIEKQEQARFRHLHSIGEWFIDSDEFDAYLKSHERSVIFGETSDVAAQLLEEFPQFSKAQIEQAVAETKAAEFADPNSPKSQLYAMFGGDDWVQRVHQLHMDRRAKDRAYWRAQRAEQVAS